MALDARDEGSRREYETSIYKSYNNHECIAT